MVRGRNSLSASHFAALEPSWAGIRNEQKLRGLLVFGSLFNRVLYVHDTQLADNPHILNSFRLRNDKPDNLYNLLKGLISNGVVRVALRDFTYIPHKDKLISCSSLAHVYDSWLIQEMEGAWVTPPSANHRIQLLGDLDDILQQRGAILQYPYQEVKKDFMERVRDAVASSDIPEFSFYLNRLPKELRSTYFAVLNRDWFSHSDLFQLLSTSEYTVEHPFVQTHGLLDEAAYANWNHSRLLGCDWNSWRAGSIVAGDPIIPRSTMAPSHEALQKQALRIMEAPGLSLLATLTADEILQLREDAAELFRIVDYVSETDLVDGLYNLRDNYLDAVMIYWERILSFLRKTRPGLTQQQTRIAVFLRGQAPFLSRAMPGYISHAINLGLDVLSIPFPNMKSIDRKMREGIVNSLSFHFLFFCDNPEIRQLKKVLPDKAWLSRFHSDVLRGRSID